MESKMNKKISSYLVILLLSLAVVNLTGCGTTQKLIKHGKLEVQTKMSDTVFLDPIDDDKKTVILQIRNTTDKEGLDIEAQIKSAIEAKGYKVVNKSKDANIMIQANILQVGKSTLEDPFAILSGGYGSTFEGMATGAMIAGATGSSGRGILGYGLLAGAANTILDAAVEVVQYSMVTDLQISEKTTGNIVSESSNASLKQGTSGYKKSNWQEKTNWKKYQTRIISVAKKVNAKFTEAQPELVQGLVRSISGLL